ncbi:hypothetical protein NUW54_g12643 [Trametes sanguinea]|uniref:Uncharacterized protein n=1 Tax=Trametes sanguinea TaxID=158606 RepID=A0ACC1MV14_9APHY|nr:hypothetical protein NUW54_g12643 [Trametes sanguinea]
MVEWDKMRGAFNILTVDSRPPPSALAIAFFASWDSLLWHSLASVPSMASGLSKDEQETLRLLVQHVSRASYEPNLKDDDLAGRVGLQLKELNKIMATLEGHKLVRIYRQNELKEGAQRSVGRQYFYIDYQSFCNVVKWRMAEMRRRIDQGLRNDFDSKGYICPQCHKSFQALEVDRLFNLATGTFNCDICNAEVIENENAENVIGSQDRMQRFNRQMRFILEGLRKTEGMVLPAFDVALWIKNHLAEQERAKAAARDGAHWAPPTGVRPTAEYAAPSTSPTPLPAEPLADLRPALRFFSRAARTASTVCHE